MKKPKPANDNRLWNRLRIAVILGCVIYIFTFWACTAKIAGAEAKLGSGWYGYMKICVEAGKTPVCHGGGLEKPYTTQRECKYWIDMMASIVVADMHKAFPELPKPTSQTRCVKEESI